MYDVQVSGVLYKIYLQAELLWSIGISRRHSCRPVFRYNISINKMQVPNMERVCRLSTDILHLRDADIAACLLPAADTCYIIHNGLDFQRG